MKRTALSLLLLLPACGGLPQDPESTLRAFSNQAESPDDSENVSNQRLSVFDPMQSDQPL
jgi:hypothetical protein